MIERLKGKVVRTKYGELIPYFLPELKVEKSIPYSDRFILFKQVTPVDIKKLRYFKDYVVVSNTMFDEVLEREQIIEIAKEINKSRRKPEWDDQMSDDEFIKNVKIFIIAGIWPKHVDDATMFPLFEKIDSPRRVEEYMKLKQDYHPRVILMGLISFSKKCIFQEFDSVNSKSYMKLLKSKGRIIQKNFMPAIRIYIKYKGEISEELRVMRFIDDLGRIK